ncbi:energy-converting hydrogenase B subunit J [Methanothermobacter wolfeii]|uniref:Energy-converting hydrogenase B subunit J n=1 Tax=Methanothermobacter wolfeii TaxID=145261 RepID=A0ABU8TSQ2_METWO
MFPGPVIFGFLLGLILGSRIREDMFPASSYLLVLVVLVLVAWNLGPFPYYTDLPIATGFVAAVLGIMTGKILFRR